MNSIYIKANSFSFSFSFNNNKANSSELLS